jgi:hypothetical protein
MQPLIRHNGYMTNTQTPAALHNYNTGDYIRPATPAELEASIEAADDDDNGQGVIMVDGIACYVI